MLSCPKIYTSITSAKQVDSEVNVKVAIHRLSLYVQLLHHFTSANAHTKSRPRETSHQYQTYEYDSISIQLQKRKHIFDHCISTACNTFLFPCDASVNFGLLCFAVCRTSSFSPRLAFQRASSSRVIPSFTYLQCSDL